MKLLSASNSGKTHQNSLLMAVNSMLQGFLEQIKNKNPTQL